MLLLIQIVILIIIFFLLYLLTWFLPTDSPWAPWWTTSKEKSRTICTLVKLSKKDRFFELGSGTGTTLAVAASEFGAKCVGIESDVTRVWWSRLKIRIMKQSHNVTIHKENFFNVDLSSASVVYLYLVPRVVSKLKPKLLQELKPGTKVVSYVYTIDYLKSVTKDMREQLYVYTVPAKKISNKAKKLRS